MSTKAADIDSQASKRFALVRKKLGLNQSEMSEVCNVTQAMVSYIESGTKDIPREAIKNLYVKHKVSPLYIIVGELPMIYAKDESKALITNISTMNTELEILKAYVRRLEQRIDILDKNQRNHQNT
jgi:transcriptional regulator with XRE-family HTH domain